MSFADIFLIFSSPVLSGIFWFVTLVLVLYFARTPAHLSITSFTRVLHNGLRLTSKVLLRSSKSLAQSNREALIAWGREYYEKRIEREFERIDAAVRRDISEYPALHRKLSEEITVIDDDYKQSTEVPPEPPAWVKAVDAVAKIPGKDPMVASILEDIHSSMVKANTQAIEEYRKASHKRHEHLKNMMPHWRTVKKVLSGVEKSISRLLTRSLKIDQHMEDYENILKGNDNAANTLSQSTIQQFFVSMLILGIAVFGALINFELIALPMSEMVEQKTQILGVETYKIAALVVILLEITVGFFLMELLHVTKLFPTIGSLNENMRVKLAWAAFAFLFTLASVEAGLAWMRHWLILDTKAADAGVQAIVSDKTWIITTTQMGLGFILPFILMFVAWALEMFVHTARHVLGSLFVGLLRFFVWALRFLGVSIKYMGNGLIHIYDFIIFAPLWLERMIKSKVNKSSNSSADIASSLKAQ